MDEYSDALEGLRIICQADTKYEHLRFAQPACPCNFLTSHLETLATPLTSCHTAFEYWASLVPGILGLFCLYIRSLLTLVHTSECRTF